MSSPPLPCPFTLYRIVNPLLRLPECLLEQEMETCTWIKDGNASAKFFFFFFFFNSRNGSAIVGSAESEAEAVLRFVLTPPGLGAPEGLKEGG